MAGMSKEFLQCPNSKCFLTVTMLFSCCLCCCCEPLTLCLICQLVVAMSMEGSPASIVISHLPLTEAFLPFLFSDEKETHSSLLFEGLDVEVILDTHMEPGLTMFQGLCFTVSSVSVCSLLIIDHCHLIFALHQVHSQPHSS